MSEQRGAVAVAAGGDQAEPARQRFTVDEYYAMAAAGILHEDQRVELLDGEILQMPPIGSGHSGDVNEFNAWFGQRLAGRAMISIQNPVRLSPYSEPVPDLMLLKPRADFYRSAHPRPEDVLLIIEVAYSTLSYDRGKKLAAYAAAGIQEVWIVDRPGSRIFVYREPRDGEYTLASIVGRDGTVAPAAFPDLVLSVAELFGTE